MNYKGVMIEESLKDTSVLKNVDIISTKVEKVVKSHKTPWLTQWTLHTVEIPEEKAQEIANAISKALESEHNWYADFKNKQFHYIVFKGKVFKVDRSKSDEYEEVKKYGISLGIPDYQLDFSPDIQ
ncbi:hypothetical protein COS80_01580 [Candidatus Woesebacteria bacterium CG06_land_8_20_14_3_00_39_27]|uniref:Uncharacterized protein n=1 Tax=Candidatus Woesebacteria bacterium CG06_land_8_20_14_3_00_39_27 TaxID=1975057 RepID=A0A2M7AQ19_9BACT|nr:MAG: hypothetical protein COS80_01580 [Candidatus Woesebacteria bacterium CG06_land_8_20_14_3_00_39_27]